MPSPRRYSIAVGPAMPGWGSWDWVGLALIEGFGDLAYSFQPWELPKADVVIVIKHAPPPGWIADVARRAAVLYCPVDHYADPADIEADACWLRLCSQVIVHCRRLESHFSPYANTAYLDHPVKYAIPTRRSSHPEGRFLWVGVRSNLPPLVSWLNDHPLSGPLDILTNPERPGVIPSAAELGIRSKVEVRVHEWSPERHLQFTAAARAALDIKGEDFRSRHKPPAKILDFIASGLPVALNPGTSAAEHLVRLGLVVPSPLDTERWLGEPYRKETERLGQKLSRELSATRVANRARRLVEAALENRPGPSIVASSAPRQNQPHPIEKSSSTLQSKATPSLKLYGLMVTKDDHAILGDWCRNQLERYDAVVCLDGSVGDESARIAAQHSERLIYLRERDFSIPHKTNHGLRRVVHDEIVRRFGTGHWIMCCHPDEFCYHDPRKIAAKADEEGYDHVAWYVPQFYPHLDEFADWTSHLQKSIPDRQRHYHWDRGGTGFPWVEDRMYRCGSGVGWDAQTHDSVRPHGLIRPAPFHPILRHYKVLNPDPSLYEVTGGSSRHLGRWEGASGRPGLPFPVRKIADFFVSSLPGYRHCDRFDGTFPHPWNLGDEYRSETSLPNDPAWQRYRAAQDLAARNDSAAARDALRAMDSDSVEDRLRALVQNDLAVLDAIAGDYTSARARFADALSRDPDCRPARMNLASLCGENESLDTNTVVDPPPPTDRPVRVAILSLLFNWPSTGGGNVHSAELPKFLAAAGYEVKHLFARFEPWRIGCITEPTPHPTEVLEFTPSEWTAAGIIDRFRRAVDEFDPDHVILTDSWNLKPLMVAAAGGRPYILRLQAMECLCPLNNVRLLPGPDGRPLQCTKHQLATPDDCTQCVEKLGSMSGDLHRAERAMAGVGTASYRESLFRAFAQAESVLAVNPLNAAMVEPHARDVRVVTAGMDPDRFPWPFPSERIPRHTPGRLRILFAGLTQEWMKGFAVLREACRGLWDIRQDFELVATDDPPGGHVEPFLRYIGWQSQEDLPAQLAGADIVAVPTVAQEALGRTAVEAMAAGKPVVASRLGGLMFTVADGATGLLCDPGVSSDLADKLSRLLDDRALRDQLGAAGRRRFEEHYAWPVIVRKHYVPLLGGPTRVKA